MTLKTNEKFIRTGSKDTANLAWHLDDWEVQDQGISYSVYKGGEPMFHTAKCSEAKDWIRRIRSGKATISNER